MFVAVNRIDHGLRYVRPDKIVQESDRYSLSAGASKASHSSDFGLSSFRDSESYLLFSNEVNALHPRR